MSVDRSVCPSPLAFSALWAVFALLLQPKCLGKPFYHCPCPPARDFGSRVSGLAKQRSWIHPLRRLYAVLLSFWRFCNCRKELFAVHYFLGKKIGITTVTWISWATVQKKKIIYPGWKNPYLCKKAWGIQWCHSQSSTPVRNMNGPKKTAKNGHFWVFLG